MGLEPRRALAHSRPRGILALGLVLGLFLGLGQGPDGNMRRASAGRGR